jgi:hypothetical protein
MYMNWMPIRTTESMPFLSKSRNWKSPGGEVVPNCRLDAFQATHNYITEILNAVIEKSKQMSD